MNSLEKDEVVRIQAELFDYTMKADPTLMDMIRTVKDLNEDIKKRITKVVQEFVDLIKSERKEEVEDIQVG